MAEEEKKETSGSETEAPSFTNAKELTTFLMDLQGQITNMQETVDKLSPVDESAGEAGSGEEPKEEELSDEEVNEIDQLLQSE